MPRNRYRPHLEVLEERRLFASTFIVTTAADTNTNPTANPAQPVSLRDAITAADALGNNGGASVIDFDIPPGGVQTINVGSTGMGALPAITSPVTINGQTEPGFNPLQPMPMIELNGAQAGSFANGLTIDAGNTTITGLIINRFSGDGIRIENQGGDVIQADFLGTDRTGTVALPNAGNGVAIIAGASQDTIGGTTATEANVISGNGQNGVLIQGSFFAGLGGKGSFLNSAGNVVEGNFIGTNSALTDLANGQNGVLIDTAAFNTIGGSAQGAGNVIAFNQLDGVRVTQEQTIVSSNLGQTITNQSVAVGDTISQNAIFSNRLLGIDLNGDGVTLNTPGGPHTGPNHFQNFPVLGSTTTSGGTITVTGSLNSTPNATFRLEFFASAVLDPSGFGQGQSYLGTITVTTDASGNATFTVSLPVSPVGSVITSTATDLSTGDTSEFSGPAYRGTQPPGPRPPPPVPPSPSQEILVMQHADPDPILLSPAPLQVVGPPQSLPTNIPPPVTAAALRNVTVAIGEISGEIFEDYNGNGIQDPDEPPARGQPVYLDINNNGVYDEGEPTAMTDEHGHYAFRGLRIGAYSVRLLLGPRTEQTSPATAYQQITLTPEQHAVGRVNFSTRRFRRVQTPGPTSEPPQREPAAISTPVQNPVAPALSAEDRAAPLAQSRLDPKPRAEEQAAALDQALRAARELPGLEALAACLLSAGLGDARRSVTAPERQRPRP